MGLVITLVRRRQPVVGQVPSRSSAVELGPLFSERHLRLVERHPLCSDGSVEGVEIDHAAQLGIDDQIYTACGSEPMLGQHARVVIEVDLRRAVRAGRGVGEGTKVSWQLPTRIDTVILSIALSRLGAVQNPIIHLYRERAVGFALRQTGSTLLCIPRQWRDTDYLALAERSIQRMGRPPEILVVDDDLPDGEPDTFPPPPVGVPAGALDMSPADVGSIAFPFAHIAGPDYLIAMLSVGFPAVLAEAFSAPAQLSLFRQHGVTMVGGSTAFYVSYLAEQRKTPNEPILPTLRLMPGGGAPKPPKIHFDVRDEIGGRGVVHGYGMTEVPMITNGSPHDTDEQLANTDGRPVPGADVRIVRLDGAEASAGQEGETISATEVEAVLYRYPKVTEVSVIGLPDDDRGELVCAVVQVATGADLLTLDEVRAFCREAGLMTQKTPEQLELRTEWPRAGTGKVVKKALREQYAGRASGPSL